MKANIAAGFFLAVILLGVVGYYFSPRDFGPFARKKSFQCFSVEQHQFVGPEIRATSDDFWDNYDSLCAGVR